MKRALTLASFAGLTFAYSCGADPLEITESDAVITILPDGTRFSGYETYYLPERVIDLCLQPDTGTPTSDAIGGAAGGPAIDVNNCFVTDHTSDGAILAALEENMNGLGYRRVDESDRDDADLALLVGLVSRGSWSLSRPYCYPNDYYPGCVAQESNPPVVVPVHSLVVQMIDVDASSEDSLSSVWTVGLHPLQEISAALGTTAGGGPSSAKTGAWNSAIDQAFRQTPVLGEGGE